MASIESAATHVTGCAKTAGYCRQQKFDSPRIRAMSCTLRPDAIDRGAAAIRKTLQSGATSADHANSGGAKMLASVIV
jgi:hypothetical protein